MPYAPGIEYRGDQYLYRGIASLGESVGQAIGNYRRNKEESQAADAAFETLVQAAAPMIQAGDLPEDMAADLQDLGKFSGLSTSAKKAKLGQLGVSLQMLQQAAEARQRADLGQQNLDLRRSLAELQQAEKDRAMRRDMATQQAMRQMAPVAGMPVDNTGVGAAYLEDALRQNPEADAGPLFELMQKAGASRAQREPTTYPAAGEMLEPFDVGGRKGLYNRRTGQTLMDAGTNGAEATPIRDENGNVIGYGVPSGNRTVVMRPPGQLSASDRQRLRQRKAEITGQLEVAPTPQAKAALEREAADIDAELAASPGSGAAAPPPAPTPARKRYNPKTGRLE